MKTYCCSDQSPFDVNTINRYSLLLVTKVMDSTGSRLRSSILASFFSSASDKVDVKALFPSARVFATCNLFNSRSCSGQKLQHTNDHDDGREGSG